MKAIIATIAGVGIALVGCTVNQAVKTSEPMIGMANPASEFCVKQGGKSEIRKNADGSEYGVCILKNGQEVDEWEYFRQYHK